MTKKRFIDANVAIEKCNKLIANADSCPNKSAIEGILIVRDLILTECETGVPTIDVVPVVRCKDCRYHTTENDYCSYGERNKGEQK